MSGFWTADTGAAAGLKQRRRSPRRPSDQADRQPAGDRLREPQEGLAPILRYQKSIISQIMSGSRTAATGAVAEPQQRRRSPHRHSDQAGRQPADSQLREPQEGLAPILRYQKSIIRQIMSGISPLA